MKFDDHGLVPAIVQDANTREVLTLAYMNAESLRQTVETGETWFWSRSRNELWHKGETSGNKQSVVELISDCDNDALLLHVQPAGPACHTGRTSCFHNPVDVSNEVAIGGDNLSHTLESLYSVIDDRKRERPEGSYTSYLFEAGIDKILQKVGEETAETIIAGKNDDDQLFVAEVSDLLYHLLVLMVARGVRLEQIAAELNRRASTRTEKNEPV